MARLRQAAAIAALLTLSLPTVADTRSPRHIVYDYAVTSYCGLLTPEVEEGFRRELAAVTEESGLTAEQAKELRIAGWVDADREWSNRGLGGFRAWCASDGAEAAARFQGVMRGRR